MVVQMCNWGRIDLGKGDKCGEFSYFGGVPFATGGNERKGAIMQKKFGCFPPKGAP